jgi:hypothetical protein
MNITIAKFKKLEWRKLMIAKLLKQNSLILRYKLKISNLQKRNSKNKDLVILVFANLFDLRKRYL